MAYHASLVDQALRSLKGVYRHSDILRSQVLDTLDAFPALSPKVEEFMFPDGRKAQLLKLEGTIPMFYKDKKYNLPCVYWIVQNFPDSPPIVYLNPTADMKIKPGHKYADASGTVSVPAMQSWNKRTSLLIVIVKEMSKVFGADPPLFKAATPAPGAFGGASVVTPPSSGPASGIGAKPRKSDPDIAPALPPSKFKSEKEKLEYEATRKVQTKLSKVIAESSTEIESLFEKQARLTEGTMKIKVGIEKMKLEKEMLEVSNKEMLAEVDGLEKWIVDKEAEKEDDLKAEEVIVARDTWSRQLFDAIAEDAAIEDTLFALDSALDEGVVTPDEFLKNIRKLSRKQFFARALVNKIYDKQATLKE